MKFYWTSFIKLLLTKASASTATFVRPKSGRINFKSNRAEWYLVEETKSFHEWEPSFNKRATAFLTPLFSPSPLQRIKLVAFPLPVSISNRFLALYWLFASLKSMYLTLCPLQWSSWPSHKVCTAHTLLYFNSYWNAVTSSQNSFPIKWEWWESHCYPQLCRANTVCTSQQMGFFTGDPWPHPNPRKPDPHPH